MKRVFHHCRLKTGVHAKRVIFEYIGVLYNCN
jgi:hypothetical protein